ARSRLDGSRRATVPSRGGLGERAGLGRGCLGSLSAQAAVAGEAPGAVHEGTDSEALALGVVEPVDAPVTCGDGLRPAQHDSRICVRSAGGERRGDSLFAELAHEPRLTAPLQWPPRAGVGIGRRARLRALWG